ncbi:C1 family peptidase [Pedobacter sp. PAMC26386]|nr:C1 family peptidase [Pedobacter sp. PAMC26386]
MTTKIKTGCIFTLLIAVLLLDACKKNRDGSSGPEQSGKDNGIQASFFSGYIPTPKAILDKVPKFNGESLTKTEAYFPTKFTLATPPIGDQGNTGTCVAWATSYAAWSAEQYYRTESKTFDRNKNIFSPNYVYNQLSTDCNSGLYVTDALDLLKNQGTCTYQTLPFSDNCSSAVSIAQKADAAKYKIANVEYYLLDKETRKNTTAIKLLLFQKHPIVFGCDVDDNMNNQDIWNNFGAPRFSYDKNFIAQKNIGHEIPVGGHAMTIIGYDDAKKAFKVQNQWGNQWREQGFFWIDYDYFGSGTYTNYVLSYDANTKKYSAVHGNTVKDVFNEAYVFLN